MTNDINEANSPEVIEAARTSLLPLIAQLLGVPQEKIPLGLPLGELGIDSLTAAELSAMIEARTGLDIPMDYFLGSQTLGELLGDGQTISAFGTDHE